MPLIDAIKRLLEKKGSKIPKGEEYDVFNTIMRNKEMNEPDTATEKAETTLGETVPVGTNAKRKREIMEQEMRELEDKKLKEKKNLKSN